MTQYAGTARKPNPGLAVTGSPAAMVELALLREQWEGLEQIHARAQSYLSTLDTMLLAPVVR